MRVQDLLEGNLKAVEQNQGEQYFIEKDVYKRQGLQKMMQRKHRDDRKHKFWNQKKN